MKAIGRSRRRKHTDSMKILKKVGILLVQTDVKCPRSDSRIEYRELVRRTYKRLFMQ